MSLTVEEVAEKLREATCPRCGGLVSHHLDEWGEFDQCCLCGRIYNDEPFPDQGRNPHGNENPPLAVNL